jgi:phage terminase large subunit-like protein
MAITVRDRPLSIAEQWAAMPERQREAFIEALSEDEAEAFLYEWEFFARPEQVPPDDESWFGNLYLAGRGSGKTRSGAEWIRKRVRQGFRYIALVGETAGDVRDVMIEGESGILAISHPSERPKYEPSKRRLTWPNGATATCYSGKEPDQLRGPQHDTAWADEIAKWQYATEAWDNLELGLRLGAKPQVFITTTPRPIKIIKDMISDPMIRKVTGSSYDNIANLADNFIRRVIRKYEGTRLGEQELHAKMLGDVPGALWTADLIEANRIRPQDVPPLLRVGVGVDPAVKKRRNPGSRARSSGTERQQADEITKDKAPNHTGIVVAGRGIDPKTRRKTLYVLHDASGEYAPKEWGDMVVQVYEDFSASRVVGERNQGGDLVESNIERACEDRGRPMLNYRDVWASTSKGSRAEPISGDTERGLVKFVGNFPQLEEQLTSMTAEEYLGVGSPDVADAFVHIATDLTYGHKVSTSHEDYEGYQR